jgi:hypothetical protein
VAESRRLQELVDDRRYDELLHEVTLDEVARAWVRYQRHQLEIDEPWENAPDWWAVDLWMDTVTDDEAWWADEARVRAGILAIVEAAHDGDVGIIGASIMEVFINDDESRLRWVEEQARVSDRFRGSLANVWIAGELRADVFLRVERAAGVPVSWPSI